MNNTNKKRIAVLTGARAEYGLLKPVMEKIKAHPDLELLTLVTGCHLQKSFGYTINDIIKDGFRMDARIQMYSKFETGGAGIVMSLGKGLQGITKVLKLTKPDVLLLIGDRGEALMGAVAASYLNIPIAHIHGGDQCAGADVNDNIRHAITKLAHLHFPATAKSAKRLRGLGEESWRIKLAGAPGLDSILHRPLPPAKEIATLLNLNLSVPVLLLLQHAVSSETWEAKRQMEETMKAITKLGLQTIILYPNTDPGNLDIIKVIEKYRCLPFVRVNKSLPHDVFLGLMKIADVMVGNSSSAIIEALSFKLPAVNIGIRQSIREHGGNLISVSHNSHDIEKAILKALHDRNFLAKVRLGKSPYGNGKASQIIASALAKVEINEKLMRKKFVLR